MAASLQERLNYLVNYSSQLIFVGGDSLSSQTQALESFLFQQGENTEIAYIVAENDADIADYRQQLCQQLLGQASTFYHRPLNECLASLNSFDGPVMIAITRAENIPRKLLQELWELVLQSRFKGNKQHLNVVLFADKDWAQEAKSWLPANNSGTPLLLSTQQASLYKAAPDYQHPIPQRHPLDEHEANNEHDIEQRPLISMGAFWAAIGLLFICVFIGVTVWQKGDDMSGLFRPLDANNEQTPLTRVPEEAKTPVSVWKPVVTTVAAVETDTSSPETTAAEANTAPDSVPAKAQVIEPKAVSHQSNAERTQNKQPQNGQPQPVALAQSLEAASTTAMDFPADKFAIQLAGFQDKALLDRFRANNQLTQATQIYQTTRNNQDWFVLVSAAHYASSAEARSAIAALPDFPNKSSVFIKSTNAILAEIAKGSATSPLSQ